MFVILLLCVSFLIILLLVNIRRNNNQDYWKKRNIEQSIDAFKKFIFGNSSIAEVYKGIYDVYPEDPYVGIFLSSDPVLLLKDLENIQQVLAGDFVNFHKRGILVNPNDKLADNVLFIEDYARWKLVRQKISPVFTTLRLKCMFEVLERCSRDFIEIIKDNKEIRKTPFDALYTYTSASIGASVFGIDTRTENTMKSPFLEMSRNAVAPSLRNNLVFTISSKMPWLYKLLGLTLFGPYENFFIGAVKKVIKARRQNPIKRFDLIDLFINLLNQGDIHDASLNYNLSMTEELLAAQAFFFFIAGADTSANTMHFTLFELANNPDILEKVHEEIDRVLEDCKENVTIEDVEKLKYLDMVINEAIRKFPPIGSITRKCVKDTVLPVGNIKVEKDILVVIPVYAIHKDEKYYPDPEKFDPERFNAENVQNRNNYCYMPFGEGNRICMGMRFARLQVKIGIAALLRRYTLRQQSEKLETFEKSTFALRAPNAYYELINREEKLKN